MHPQSRIIILLFFLIQQGFSHAQTLGLLQYDPDVFEAYTLIAGPRPQVFLIDKCGKVANEWNLISNPGLSTYLLEDGRLLRTGKVQTTFNGGGSGGRVEIFDWNSNLEYRYDISDDRTHQHHDVEMMPNGNILVLAWEGFTFEEGVEMGRDANMMGPNGIWLEQILELRPIGTNEAEIVWEWHLRDHLVQDRNASLNNFGSVSESVGKLDINYPQSVNPDIIHCNAIDYNPYLDQIILSSRALDEIWVIDHSTTTEEAATSMGGVSGKGGDFLFRWGNPEAYQRGSEADRQLFGQHDAQWIESGLPGAGNILIYNNGNGRPGQDFSESVEIVPPLQSDGNYTIDDIEPYGPEQPVWTYGNTVDQFFYSARISGTERLANGNTTICVGDQGRVLEVTPDGKLVWEYISPVSNSGILSQGDMPIGNSMFRAYSYAPDFSGLIDQNLEASNPIEMDPIDYECEIVSNVIGQEEQGIQIVNPMQDQYSIYFESPWTGTLSVFDIKGRLIETMTIEQERVFSRRADYLAPGLYILHFENSEMSFSNWITKQ